MLSIEDAFGHGAREVSVAAISVEIWGIASRPRAALSASVHDEVSVARACPKKPIEAELTSAAVADEFDNAWDFASALFWKDEPAFDGLSAKAVEGDIVRLLCSKPVVHFFEGRVEGE